MNPQVPPLGENALRPGPAGPVELSKPAEISENEAVLAVMRVVATAAILNMAYVSALKRTRKKA